MLQCITWSKISAEIVARIKKQETLGVGLGFVSERLFTLLDEGLLKPLLDAVVAAGLASPSADYELGGMQLPALVASVSGAYLNAAASMTMGYIGLTNANANLINAHGTPQQKKKWLEHVSVLNLL